MKTTTNTVPTPTDVARAIINMTKTRSAWSRGVKTYAMDLLELLGWNINAGVYSWDILNDRARFEDALLGGAVTWKQYSYGAYGCALYYDGDIAERLCAPWELRKTDGGRKNPNPSESWLDVQARALYQACDMILRVVF